MSIKKILRDALLPIGVPVSAISSNNTADEYIVFNEYNQASALNADDDELSTKHFYQVDVYTKGDFTDIVAEVETRLKAASFKRMFSSETYDSDAQKYRKILRFSYTTDIE
jgi:thiamine pyrophosphate-dependent acetolactate synthase large subunit-like protein